MNGNRLTRCSSAVFRRVAITTWSRHLPLTTVHDHEEQVLMIMSTCRPCGSTPPGALTQSNRVLESAFIRHRIAVTFRGYICAGGAAPRSAFPARAGTSVIWRFIRQSVNAPRGNVTDMQCPAAAGPAWTGKPEWQFKYRIGRSRDGTR